MKQNIPFFQGIFLLLSAVLLLPGCSGSESDEQEKGGGSQPEIRFNADVWQVMERTRATTFDNQTALQTEAHFICTVYNENSTDEFIPATQIDWNSSSTSWVFSDGRHNWPASGSLDFFAYMPVTATYISSLTYSATSSPSVTHSIAFSADLSSGASKEFVFALTTGQNKTNAASGVNLTFLHPFARVKFATGTIPSTVTINSVSLSGVMTKGDYSYSYESSTSSWSNQSATGSISGLDDWIITVPYNNNSQTLTVNCTWSDWSNVTKDLTASITANWTAGTSYTYTLNISKDYALTVDATKFTEQW